MRLLARLVVCGLSVVSCLVVAGERITLWDSVITVYRDARITVHEKYVVNSTGDNVRHGIMRDMPIRYKGFMWLTVNAELTDVHATLDGYETPFRKTVLSDGNLRFFLGDPTITLAPGMHVFTFTYTSTLMLTQGASYDELYFNVTGLGSMFPIDQVNAVVYLPHDPIIANGQIEVHAYTGFADKYDNACSITPVDPYTVRFATTRPFQLHEGLAVSVSWPLGVITHSAMYWNYVRSNMHLILLLVSLLASLLLYIYAFMKLRRGVIRHPIVPLFYPPKDLSPGTLRYCLKKGVADTTCFAADVLDLAVKGFLTLTNTSGSALESLKKNKQPPRSPTAFEQALMHSLFGDNREVCSLRDQAQDFMTGAYMRLTSSYATSIDSDYVPSIAGYIGTGVGITLAAVLGLFYFFPYVLGGALDVWVLGLLAVHILMHVLAYVLLPTYTQKGQNLYEMIAGFNMFLATTDSQRIKMFGVPPLKTVGLYEQYLPYAVAFGVEKAWTQQFASLFAQLEREGKPYQPVWFHGPGWFIGMPLSRSLASSLQAPMIHTVGSLSSTGRGGGGSPGGGRGGGGVGGW